MVIRINRLPAGFVIPAQPVLASKAPVGTDWVHEIKHDGYRIVVRRDGPTVRLYSRNAYDWTVRLASIAAAAERIKAKSFTIDGEAVVLGPDGLSRFEELSRREAARTATLYAFDLIEHDGEDLRNLPFLDRKAALVRLLRDTKAGILFNEHIAEDGATVFAHACRLWGGGHRIEEGRWRLSGRSLSGLDQGPQSRQHRGAAGAERDVESMNLRIDAQKRKRRRIVGGG
jgi:bifunctional non-homologous end joining protein LigD